MKHNQRVNSNLGGRARRSAGRIARALPLAAVVLVTGFVAGAGVAETPPPPTALPVEMTVALTHDLYSFDAPPNDLPRGINVSSRNTVMTTSQYLWRFSSYSDWTFTKLCCPDPLTDSDDSGWSYRVTPTGDRLLRSAPEEQWERVGSYNPEDGWTPLPDLAPVPASTDLVLERLAESDLPSGVFSVAPEDLARYQLGTRIIVVYEPLGLPLVVTEVDANGELVRELVVTQIQPG